MKAFQNSALYQVEDYDTLLQSLKESSHFLLYTGGNLDDNDIYLIDIRELSESSDEEIINILESHNLGSDILPKLDIKNSLKFYNKSLSTYSNWDSKNNSGSDIFYNHVCQCTHGGKGTNAYIEHVETTLRINNNINSENKNLDVNIEAEKEMLELEAKLQSLGYLLILHLSEHIVWENSMYNLSEATVIKFENFSVRNELDTVTLITQGSIYALEYQCDRFQQVVGLSVFFSWKENVWWMMLKIRFIVLTRVTLDAVTVC